MREQVRTDTTGRRAAVLGAAIAVALALLAPARAGSAVLGLAPDDRSPRAEAAAAIARDDASADDPEARAAAVAALGDRAGAVVALDPRTGRVVTIVNQEWAVRRAVHPASTLKLLTALACLGERAVTPRERLRVEGLEERLDLERALARSNTAYFQEIGERIGREPFLRYAAAYGFGEPTGIDLAGEAAGRLPTDGDYESGLVFGASYGARATPLQLAVFTAAIANGGRLLVPQRSPGPVAPRVRRETGASAADLAAVRLGMVGAVRYGTASASRDRALPVAGKTGTSRESGVGLYVSFAPVESPRIVVAVLLEGPGVMGGEAAQVAGAFYRSMKGKI